MNIILLLSILLGSPQQAVPAEDDARHEAVWAIGAAVTGEDNRIYEPGRSGIVVGSVDTESECTVMTTWNDGAWSALTIECP
jgi:hypothetical protein